MPSERAIQLRQLLAERLPGLLILSESSLPQERANWPTGLIQMDNLPGGGFPKGAITECVAENQTSGSALLISSLLQKAMENNEILVLIDGQDSFDPTAFAQPVLSRLLWVRCQNTAEALKATDLILRDRNLPLVLLDLKLNPARQLQKIPSSTWYRLRRIVESTSTTLAVFTPRALVGCAQMRINLNGTYGLELLAQDQKQAVQKLRVELAHHRLHVSNSGQDIAKTG
jgi:hypothetical protein